MSEPKLVGTLKYVNTPKYAGKYRVNQDVYFRFSKKPNIFHRFFTRIFLGWVWEDE